MLLALWNAWSAVKESHCCEARGRPVGEIMSRNNSLNLTYSSHPFLCFCKESRLHWAHGRMPFLPYLSTYSDISQGPSLAQHQPLGPSFGACFLHGWGLQSPRGLSAQSCSHHRTRAGPKRKGGGGAWMARREAGERHRKKVGIRESCGWNNA